MTIRNRFAETPTPVLRVVLSCETMPPAMTAWLSVLVPLLMMFFALGMERVERRLRETTVRQEDLEEFLEHAQPDEVNALFGHGTSRALELFRLRSSTSRRAVSGEAPSNTPRRTIAAVDGNPAGAGGAAIGHTTPAIGAGGSTIGSGGPTPAGGDEIHPNSIAS